MICLKVSRRSMEFILVDDVRDVLQNALLEPKKIQITAHFRLNIP